MRIFSRREAPSQPPAPLSYEFYVPTAGWRPAPPDPRLIDQRLLDPHHNTGLDSILARRFPMITAALLIRHGYVLYERYVAGSYAGKLEELYGITQPVVSALIGIALQQGLLHSLDERLLDLLPDDYDRNAQPQAQQLTVRHLLTMTSGFAGDPRQQEMVFYRVHHVDSILNGPMAHDPGAVFAFDDANVQLLSHVLTALTGGPASRFARQYLFQPLGIDMFMWTQDEQDFSHCWAGLSLSTHDLAKFGFLYLKGGVWDSQQIIPAGYVREATTAQSVGGYPGNTAFGYLWWASQERGHDAFFALGYGGRLLMIVPDLDLIIILMTDDSLDMEHIGYPRQLASEVIIPGIPAG